MSLSRRETPRAGKWNYSEEFDSNVPSSAQINITIEVQRQGEGGKHFYTHNLEEGEAKTF